MPRDSGRAPRWDRRVNGRWLALMLAIVVNLAFIGVLIFSVTWRNPPSAIVSAELYAPQPKAPEPRKVEAPKPEPPKPEPEPPRPEPPKPEPPKPEPPKPEPPKVDPKVEQQRRDADIALKKQEENRKREVEEKRKREIEEKQRADEQKKLEDRKLAEARIRQQRETEAMLQQAERESRSRSDADAKVRAEADARARAAADAQAKTNAENAARLRAETDWIRRIQAKVRGNIILPGDLPGNPEAIFDVVQLPTGEILDVQLRKSSGVRAYDDAVQRAILKSSPLPQPNRQELFQRTLTLKFRPID
ncbi:MAG TPA: cell envelope integrity protein TolA [Casimicrobiaceae bacterium]|nr:cell envelope integrity protein TolA [Casimicrobiaceae bacterium]